MLTAALVTLLVFGLLAGLIIGIRNSAKTGIPPKDVLDRATQRSRQQHSDEED